MLEIHAQGGTKKNKQKNTQHLTCVQSAQAHRYTNWLTFSKAFVIFFTVGRTKQAILLSLWLIIYIYINKIRHFKKLIQWRK